MTQASFEVVDRRDLPTQWLWIGPEVQRAMDESPRAIDSAEEVYRQAVEGFADIVLIEGYPGGRGTAVIELLETKQGPYLNVWGLSGVGMDNWLDAFVAWTERVSKRRGCKGVMLGGRKGWARRLKQYGFKTECVIMTRENRLCH